ncbi:MAG: hypothetical protein WCV73_05090 [Patescibacteria group bacterium]|jgi:hypothetical protein
MQLTIDLTVFNKLLDLSPAELILYFFTKGGWIIVAIALISGLGHLFLHEKRKKYLASIEHTLLAIDIPKDNEQSLVAVEQIFATLAGIKSGANLVEKYWHGETQLSFSLEIISLEGYIQFLIRTPAKFKDLTEAAIYAQYPEAEITEVNDYVSLIPEDIHKVESDYDVWATEFTLAKPSAYPIKTYTAFEHQLAESFIDPMSALLEVMSKIGQGEQLGLQLVITPVDDHWKHKGEAIVEELIGAKGASKKHLGDKMVDRILGVLEKFSEAIYKMWGDIKTEKESPNPSLYQFLTVGQKNVVEAIENKLAKICFSASFRVYYLAHKDHFKKSRGVNTVLGAINQFNTSNLNAFKKYGKLTTHRDYFFVEKRVNRVKKKLLKYYKTRSRKGSTEFYLSTEEIATLYHFPNITVKAPLLKKSDVKTAEPPTSLPIEYSETQNFFMAKTAQPNLTIADLGHKKDDPQILPEKETKPEEKFVITESLPGYDFDNDYFEQHFAKNRTISNATPIKKELDKTVEPPSNLPIS